MGASCATGIVFTPIADGVAIGTLTVSSSSVANPAVSALTGIGGAAGTVLIQPSLLKFSATGVGTVSSTQLVTVTNSSAVTLSDLGSQLHPVDSGLPTPPASSHLAPGASCTATVTFAPANAGQQTGYLTIRSSMLPSAVQVPLSGMGVDFSAAVSGGSSQVIASGQTARYTVVLSPLNGSSGTFAFQCGSLPANAACSFNPTSETVAANTTGSIIVQIATGQATVIGAVRRAAQPGNGIANSSDVVRAHTGALGLEWATQGAAPGCAIRRSCSCWSDELCRCRWWDGNGADGGFDQSYNAGGHLFRSGQRHYKWRDAQGDRLVDSGLDPQELSFGLSSSCESIGQWLDANAKRLYFIFGRPPDHRVNSSYENAGCTRPDGDKQE